MADTDTELVAHALTSAHVAGGLALSGAAGWNQNEADWRLFLQLGHGFGLSTAAGELVATTMIVPFAPPRFAWISVVLVAASHRRRGLATRLTMQALEALAESGEVPVLDATPQGREVYRQLDFRDAWLLQRLLLKGAPASVPVAPLPGVTIRSIGASDWERIAAYDARVFGADRRALLEAFAARLPHAALIALRGDAVVGYLTGRDGRIADQLGPLSADSPEIALALLQRALAAAQNPVFIDLPERHAPVREWLAQVGFTIGRPFSRMVLGVADTFDDHARLVLSAGPEFG